MTGMKDQLGDTPAVLLVFAPRARVQGQRHLTRRRPRHAGQSGDATGEGF